MLSKLTLRINNPNGYGYEISSLLHGVIMEYIDSGYADVLHEEGLHPYAQSIVRGEGYFDWIITAFTSEAKAGIIDNLINLSSIRLEYKDESLLIMDKSLQILSYENMITDTYFGECSRKIRLDFVTPTAFKVNGRYQFYPTIEHIFKSLMNKHDSAGRRTEVYSEDIVKQLIDNVYISSYKLKSVRFPMEGVAVPAFMGSITLVVKGPQQLANFVNMLCKFGEYSGVGIKTGIGMGAISYTPIGRKEK